MRGALQRLAVGLQAVAQAAQQLGDRLVTDLVALLAQRPGERPHALGRPQQRRLRIPARLVGDHCLEILDQSQVGLGELRTACPRPTHPARPGRVARADLSHPSRDRRRRHPRRPRDRGQAPATMRQRLRAGPTPTTSLVQLAHHRPIPITYRALIDHATVVLRDPADTST
jgi:hypothetical protein